MALKYQRILLKISGEALGGEKGTGFDEPTMDAICGGVKKAHDLGVQIGIVVGGGNFWRGRSSGKMERTLADKIGMLATVMNALAVSDKLEQLGVETEVFTSITMPQVAPASTRKDALKAMADGKIAIFGGGTGNPFFLSLIHISHPCGHKDLLKLPAHALTDGHDVVLGLVGAVGDAHATGQVDVADVGTGGLLHTDCQLEQDACQPVSYTHLSWAFFTPPQIASMVGSSKPVPFSPPRASPLIFRRIR